MKLRHKLKLFAIYAVYRVAKRPLICGAGGTDPESVRHRVKFYPRGWQEFLRIWPLHRGRYNEIEVLRHYLDHCIPGATVVDIGAHIGTYTLFAARATGERGKVYAFEMDAQNFDSLCLNVRDNCLDNVVAINKAVSSESGVASYSRCSKAAGDGGASISHTQDGGHAAEMVTLDEMIDQGHMPIPDIIKIDVEGHEIEVIKGMSKTLRTGRPIIFVEVHPALLKMRGSDSKAFESFLESLGYRLKMDLTTQSRGEKHHIYERTS